MIPRANITAWRKSAPWPDDAQVEQDLVLSRALVELFNQPTVAARTVFRGGTALHKLFFNPPGRYSEDIDLVQRDAGPIGALVDAIRSVLDSWLGVPKWKAGQGRFTLSYRFETTFAPVVQVRVKIEINTREHFAVHGVNAREFRVANDWFNGRSEIPTYGISELLETKLRALYQRKKGRDLFDLWLGLEHSEVDTDDVIEAFQHYVDSDGSAISRAQFEANMTAKMLDPTFLDDLPSLLRTGLAYDPQEGWRRVHGALIAKLPGEPWKGDGDSAWTAESTS